MKAEENKKEEKKVEKIEDLFLYPSSDSIPSISLFGYGKTTKAIAQKLRNAIFFDDNTKEPFIDEKGFKVFPSSFFDPKKSLLEIPSPGIPPFNPLIKRAANLISEYDLFLSSFFNSKNIPFTIWISGTNGKTTTTQMIAHLLKKRGAELGGNIGTPLANLDENAKIWTLETSSFTLHYTKFAKPNLYILLPISEDHISWHGSFKAYEKAKLKPIRALKEGEVCIIPKKYENIETNGMKIVYEKSEDLAKYFNIDIKKISFKEPFLLDALLALGVTKTVFDEIDYELINSFEVDSHKIEEFFDNEGRLWVDDSKATNINAAMEAVKRYKDKKIYLIAGGDAKGADLEPFVRFLKNFEIEIFAIGKDSDTIFKLSKKHFVICKRVVTLKRAVEEIKKVLDEKSVALLSPACASLDQFKSYKERGKKFKKYVLE
ncbi:UDP-N-acetylmuramoyl-L-alanine--D-glutamate ligase [Nitrosophilus labii]|uniref:UDP-N-acetylmuramoyl-L-alanine--D-glutamate ligase n=1 Tax=Nitrosophilus labii TaxID=2706014 RepID=UPI001656E4D0|nr:UDP-N-acetylmuramoyl-L-alanine--D-glutamate ligase [Nitrosophilus labii]